MHKNYLSTTYKKRTPGFSLRIPYCHSFRTQTIGQDNPCSRSFQRQTLCKLRGLRCQRSSFSRPRSFLSQFPQGAVLDEIQNAPQLLSYLQLLVDSKDEKGLFILTGSHQLQAHQAITQSLAGRAALLNLLPLSLEDCVLANITLSIDEALFYGGYPRIYKDQLNPTKAYRNYFQTYIERDLRQLIQLNNLSLFQKFIKVTAGRIGQLINYESLANDVGVSSHTIRDWISILEASFILFKLEPYFENFGKRHIKSSKLYFTDVGFATYLLNIESIAQLERDPLRGHLIENLVVLELVKARYNKGLDPHLYFYRDSNGNEVDIIFQKGRELVPIEVKAAQTFHTSMLKNLTFFHQLIKERAPYSFLVYTGQFDQKLFQTNILNYQKTARIVDEGAF